MKTYILQTNFTIPLKTQSLRKFKPINTITGKTSGKFLIFFLPFSIYTKMSFNYISNITCQDQVTAKTASNNYAYSNI